MKRQWLLAAIAASLLAGNAWAGWFGPDEKDVKITVYNADWAPGPKSCETAFPNCVRICLQLENTTRRATLQRVDFDVYGQAPGRSTRYHFGSPVGGDTLSSDSIIQPRHSAVSCYVGYFAGSPSGALNITVEATGAKFE